MWFKRRPKPAAVPIMAEFRDVSRPPDAERVAAEFGREIHFAADLLRVRPWLPPQTPGREVVAAILNHEWTGFLALLGEYGPWVYAGGVSDLQRLSRLYGTLAAAASVTSAMNLNHAAQRRPDSLLARLNVSEQQPGGTSAQALAALEDAFWHETEAQARARYEAWQRRR